MFGFEARKQLKCIINVYILIISVQASLCNKGHGASVPSIEVKILPLCSCTLLKEGKNNNEWMCKIWWSDITGCLFREVRSINVYGSSAVFSYPIQFSNQYTCSHVSRTEQVCSLHIRWTCDTKVSRIREYHSEMSTVRRTVLLIHTDSSQSELQNMYNDIVSSHICVAYSVLAIAINSHVVCSWSPDT
jgi:hypothetical protein